MYCGVLGVVPDTSKTRFLSPDRLVGLSHLPPEFDAVAIQDVKPDCFACPGSLSAVSYLTSIPGAFALHLRGYVTGLGYLPSDAVDSIGIGFGGAN